jgi:hypothetical protein
LTIQTRTCSNHSQTRATPATLTPKTTDNQMSYKKVGGLHFVRVWRFGFSFFIARRR